MANLYDNGNPVMIDSGTFWRCRHGHTKLGRSCWKCGVWHPIRYIKDLMLDLRGGQ